MRRWLVAVFAIAVSLGVSGAAAAQCEAVEAKVDSMHVEMTGSFADIDGKFDSAWAALDSMDQLLFQIAVDVEDSYYGLYNAIGSDHVDIYTREQQILDSVAAVDIKIDSLAGELAAVNSRIDGLEALLNQVLQAIDALPFRSIPGRP